ncbi:MAG TPA: hypothetical protein VMA77_27655 [Solirubrobacteraceae bacterium]|nr:hypothetical protein [Solirubrobacteraceae bacterium]
MPEPPIPSPTADRRLARNLFVESDPDLDTLAQSTADEPARSAGARRRGRGLVVLAEPDRSLQSPRVHDAERFTRADGDVAGLRAAACHVIRQADAAAGRLLRDLAARRYRALVTMVALTVVLVAVSWLVLDVRDTATERAVANGRLARNAVTLRRQQARIALLTAEVRQLEKTADQSQASVAPPGPLDVRPGPTTRTPPTDRHDR